MRAPLTKHIKAIISDRKNATKIVREILEHEDSENGENSEITIEFDDKNRVVLEEIGVVSVSHEECS